MPKIKLPSLPIEVVFLSRLLARPILKMRLDPESMLSTQVADRLRFLTVAKRFPEGVPVFTGIWFKIANERKCSRILGMILKAMGVLPGVPDFAFMGRWGCGLIELKVDDGRKREGQLSEFQKYFKFWCEREGVKYAICRSVLEVESTLQSWGALL